MSGNVERIGCWSKQEFEALDVGMLEVHSLVFERTTGWRSGHAAHVPEEWEGGYPESPGRPTIDWTIRGELDLPECSAPVPVEISDLSDDTQFLAKVHPDLKPDDLGTIFCGEVRLSGTSRGTPMLEVRVLARMMDQLVDSFCGATVALLRPTDSIRLNVACLRNPWSYEAFVGDTKAGKGVGLWSLPLHSIVAWTYRIPRLDESESMVKLREALRAELSLLRKSQGRWFLWLMGLILLLAIFK
jgi:hypothetical protein